MYPFGTTRMLTGLLAFRAPLRLGVVLLNSCFGESTCGYAFFRNSFDYFGAAAWGGSGVIWARCRITHGLLASIRCLQ